MDRPLRLLFVCTGNTCRSPMAEVLCRSLLQNPSLPLPLREAVVASAGLAAFRGQPASQQAQEVMEEDFALDLRQHRAQLLTEEMIREADWVLTMTHQQAAVLQARWPERWQKIQPLAALLQPGKDVEDPYGQSKESYRLAAQEIQQAIRAHLSLWKEAYGDHFEEKET